MSVPKTKRGNHDFKIITESNKLFVSIARWLEKDFRKANKNITIKDLGECYHFQNNDLEIIKVIFERYKVGTINVNYDNDIIKYFKELLLNDTKEFRNYVNKANEIYCYTGQDYFLRRHSQLSAKAAFRSLLNDIAALKEIFNLHYDAYLMTTVCKPMYLINKLLKSWIESDAKRFIKKTKDGSVQYIGLNNNVDEYKDFNINSELESDITNEETATLLGLSEEDVETIDPKPKVNTIPKVPNIIQQVMPVQPNTIYPYQAPITPMYNQYNNIPDDFTV